VERQKCHPTLGIQKTAKVIEPSSPSDPANG